MIENLNIYNEIINGTKEVFSTMLMVEIDSDGESEEQPVEANLVSMIGLGGSIKGVLAVHCPADTAKAITGAFLGMKVDSIDEDVKDAIGEIANMVAGNLKISCAKIDINVELAIPTSIVGEKFTLSGIADANRVVVPFQMGTLKFWIELFYVLS